MLDEVSGKRVFSTIWMLWKQTFFIESNSMEHNQSAPNGFKICLVTSVWLNKLFPNSHGWWRPAHFSVATNFVFQNFNWIFRARFKKHGKQVSFSQILSLNPQYFVPKIYFPSLWSMEYSPAWKHRSHCLKWNQQFLLYVTGVY